MLFKLMLFVIIVQDIIQVSTAKWEILLPNRYGQANYVSNFQRQNNPYSNTYNPGWKNHLNFSWSNNQGQAIPLQQFPQQEKKPTLEDMLMQYIQKTDVAIQNNSASIRNLEV